MRNRFILLGATLLCAMSLFAQGFTKENIREAHLTIPEIYGVQSQRMHMSYNDDYEGLIYLSSFEEDGEWTIKDKSGLLIGGGEKFPGIRAADGLYYMTSEPDFEIRNAKAYSPRMELEAGEQYYISLYAYTPGYAYPPYYTICDEFRVIARNTRNGSETVVIDHTGDNARVFSEFTKCEGIFTPEVSEVYEIIIHLCTSEVYVEKVAFDRFAIGTSPDPYVFDPPQTLPIPNGEHHSYLLNYTHSLYGNGYLSSSVCWGTNDTIYVRGLTSNFPTAWVYGVKNGDKIAFPTNQFVGTFIDAYDAYLVGGKEFITKEIDGEMRWGYIPSDTIYMEIVGDTIKSIDPYGYVEMIHDMVTGEMIGSLGYNVNYKYHPFEFKDNAPAAGAPEPILYHLTADVYGPTINNNRLTNVVIDGDKFYLQGASLDTPEAWLCGTIKDNTVVFPAHQYLGMFQNYFPVFFEPMIIDTVSFKMELLDEYVMDYVDGVLTSRNNYLISQDGSNYSYAVLSLKLKPYELKPATPKAPISVRYFENAAFESSYVGVIYECLDVDGEYILPEYLYYRFYVDGELFTFQKPDYQYVQSPMTEVNVLFTDNWSFNIISENQFIFYINPWDLEFDEIAVEMVYRVDGIEGVSEKTIWNKEDGAVEHVNNNKAIVDEVYTNMQGVRVAGDTDGILIKTVIYSDGSIENIKILNRKY